MVESIRKYFGGLPDPRHPRGRRDRQVNKNHGRLQTRQLWCTEPVEGFADRD